MLGTLRHLRPRCLRRWHTGCTMATDAHGIDDYRTVKQELRKTIKQRLRTMSSEQMQQQSAAIAQHVLQLQAFKQSSSIGIYVTCERLREVDTSSILAAALMQGKRCYVPLVKDSNSNMQLLHIDSLDDLHPAPPFGILEPASTQQDGSPREDVLTSAGLLDVLVLPGLGFDMSGGRLGRGGGYYDKFISDIVARAQQLGRPPPVLLALAFREQVVEGVPMGQLDRQIDVLLLPDGAASMPQQAS